MGNNIIEGNWMQIKGRVRERWGKLTDDDVEQVAGKKDLLVGKLQERYGLALKDAESKVDEFVHSVTEMMTSSDKR